MISGINKYMSVFIDIHGVCSINSLRGLIKERRKSDKKDEWKNTGFPYMSFLEY